MNATEASGPEPHRQPAGTALATPAAEPLLQVRDLRVAIRTDAGTVQPVDGIGFTLEAGRTLAIVGESGCGKSLTSLALMGLLPAAARIASGSVRFEGRELVGAPAESLRRLRGDRMAMIFQEPMSSLNPAYTIGAQIVEALMCHRELTATQARAQAIEALERVRMPAASQRFHDYPHRLSGGMRQRAMIAMALACAPRLLIADEPTTALDVTIQAQILALMAQLREQTGAAIVLISHDLGVVAELADTVAVMYAGRIVEHGPVGQIFTEPQHPYTIGLLGSMPRLDDSRHRLPAIDGQVPQAGRMPPGCRFAARCPFVAPLCHEQDPALRPVGAHGHRAACLRAPLPVPADDAGSDGDGPMVFEIGR